MKVLSASITLRLAAPSGVARTYQIVTQPEHGTLVSLSCHFTSCEDVLDALQPGQVTYEPDIGFRGDDSFTFRVQTLDGIESNIATVSVTVF